MFFQPVSSLLLPLPQFFNIEFTYTMLDIQSLWSYSIYMDINENTSDGFHTFKELYEMRLLLTANLFNEWASIGSGIGFVWDVCKSKLHSDGSIPFNDPNWFIVVAQLDSGQVSFHYEMKDWDLFEIPEMIKAPEFDGHTSEDVAIRLRKYIVG